MADTERSIADILGLWPLNSAQQIGDQDGRDMIVSLVKNIFAYDGYSDGEHTSGSPQAVTAASTVQLTNNGALLATPSRMPGDGAYWNTTTDLITLPRLNEVWTVRVGFTYDQTGGGTNHYVRVDFVIPDGGGDIIIGSETLAILKDDATIYLENFKFFVGSSLLSNGLRIDLTPSVNGDLYGKNITVFAG